MTSLNSPCYGFPVLQKTNVKMENREFYRQICLVIFFNRKCSFNLHPTHWGLIKSQRFIYLSTSFCLEQF